VRFRLRVRQETVVCRATLAAGLALRAAGVSELSPGDTRFIGLSDGEAPGGGRVVFCFLRLHTNTDHEEEDEDDDKDNEYFDENDDNDDNDNNDKNDNEVLSYCEMSIYKSLLLELYSHISQYARINLPSFMTSFSV
jgi:hypothetical protein